MNDMQSDGNNCFVCGPGNIAQAHKPNEFIPLDQIAKGEDFMRRLLEEVSAD